MNWLKPSIAEKATNRAYISNHDFNNDRQNLMFGTVYLMTNVALFIFSACRYWKSNWCIIIARGCGMCLNFDCAFVLVLTLRLTLTKIRTSCLAMYLPLDHNIVHHKLTGWLITGLSLIHTSAHIGNIGRPIVRSDWTVYIKMVFTPTSLLFNDPKGYSHHRVCLDRF